MLQEQYAAAKPLQDRLQAINMVKDDPNIIEVPAKKAFTLAADFPVENEYLKGIADAIMEAAEAEWQAELLAQETSTLAAFAAI